MYLLGGVRSHPKRRGTILMRSPLLVCSITLGTTSDQIKSFLNRFLLKYYR